MRTLRYGCSPFVFARLVLVHIESVGADVPPSRPAQGPVPPARR
jgi:hypothetical protein